MFSGLAQDVRYAVRGIRRSPLFAATASATIGLGLGLLCSAFTVVNAYVLRPIGLPDARALVAIRWETDTVQRHRFSWNDFEALRGETPHMSGVAGGTEAMVMRDGSALQGLLVTGDYFTLLGADAALGRPLRAGDGDEGDVRLVILSDQLWRTQYGADPAVIGSTIALGRQRFTVLGVMPPGFGPAGAQIASFWAPLASASDFGLMEPRREPDAARLWMIGRLREKGTEAQLSTWLEVWLGRRYPADSPQAPRAVGIESLATRLPLTDKTLALLTVILSSFGLVLLVACANVTNLILARTLARQRELAVRLSLGSSRWRVMRADHREPGARGACRGTGVRDDARHGARLPCLGDRHVPRGHRSDRGATGAARSRSTGNRRPMRWRRAFGDRRGPCTRGADGKARAVTRLPG